MTLLELTVIILVMLSLVTILLLGARAWRRGSDRASCILNISAVQKAVRSYANMYGFEPESTVPSLQDKLIGPEGFISAMPSCPGGGTCTCGQEHGQDVIPPLGELYMTCSKGESLDHTPKITSDW